MLHKIIPIIPAFSKKIATKPNAVIAPQQQSLGKVKNLNLDLNQVCMDCGACCSYFRVSFYFGELDVMPHGFVPEKHTKPLTPHLSCMNGTNYSEGQSSQRCECLTGTVGSKTECSIYSSRPTPCREFNPYNELGEADSRCNSARLHHGLKELKNVVLT